jgi:hypothetical protein
VAADCIRHAQQHAMSFKEWLPFTKRNRVALALAFLALVMFATWNCFPYYAWEDEAPEGLVMMVVWPETFSPDNYLSAFRSPDVETFLEIAAYMALVQSGVVTLFAVPFWKLLHASAFVRLPLAIANLFGGAVVVWHLLEYGLDDQTPFAVATLAGIALGMFVISAALFTFKNELALRGERSISHTHDL